MCVILLVSVLLMNLCDYNGTPKIFGNISLRLAVSCSFYYYVQNILNEQCNLL